MVLGFISITDYPANTSTVDVNVYGTRIYLSDAVCDYLAINLAGISLTTLITDTLQAFQLLAVGPELGAALFAVGITAGVLLDAIESHNTRNTGIVLVVYHNQVLSSIASLTGGYMGAPGFHAQ
jgi:hypothetical protein